VDGDSPYSDFLRAGRSGDRIPVGARFAVPVQNVPGAHPASYTMDTGFFPGIKRPGRGVDHPLPSRAEVEGRVELYIFSPSGPSWSVLGWPLSLPLPLSLPKIMVFSSVTPCILVGLYQASKKSIAFILSFKIIGGRKSVFRIFGIFLSDCVESHPRSAITFTVKVLGPPSLAQCCQLRPGLVAD